MQLNTLARTHKRKRAQSVGRGGKRGKTSGRGTKGQNSRSGHKKRPELRDIIKTLPKLRGRGKNIFKSFASANVVVNVSALESAFNSGDTISPKELLEKKLIRTHNGIVPKVKILADGDISKKFSISGCLVSKEAKSKIEKAGGAVR